MSVVPRATIYLFVLLTALAVSSCGGGGGGDSSSDTNSSSSDDITTSLSGWATKGPLAGEVNVYSIDGSGQRGTLISGPVTVVDGRFELSLPDNPSFPLEVVLTSGQYQDESTGANILFESGDELLGIIGSGSDSVLSITPITTAMVLQLKYLLESNPVLGETLAYQTVVTDAVSAFGFNPLTTPAYDPLDLPTTSSNDENAYAALIGGFSSMSAPTQSFWVTAGLTLASQKSLVFALIEDIADGSFDGFDLTGATITIDDGSGSMLNAPLIANDVAPLFTEATAFATDNNIAVTLSSNTWATTVPTTSGYELVSVERVDGSSFSLTASVTDLQITSDLVAWTVSEVTTEPGSLVVHDLSGNLGTTQLADEIIVDLDSGPFIVNTSVEHAARFLASGNKVVWKLTDSDSTRIYNNTTGSITFGSTPVGATLAEIRPGGALATRVGAPTTGGDPQSFIYFSQDGGASWIEYLLPRTMLSVRTCNSQPCFANLSYGVGDFYNLIGTSLNLVYSITDGSPDFPQFDGAFATWFDFDDFNDYVYQQGTAAPVALELGTHYLNGAYILNSDSSLEQIILTANPTTNLLDPVRRELVPAGVTVWDARTSSDESGQAYVIWIQEDPVTGVNQLRFFDGSSIHTLRDDNNLEFGIGTQSAIYGNTVVWEEFNLTTLDSAIMRATLVAQ